MRPTIVGIAGAVLVAVALLFSACSTLAALDKAQVAGEGLRKAATVVLDARCETAAKACPSGKAEDCKPLADCWALRRRVFAASDAIQIAVAAGCAAEVSGADDGNAGKTWLARATAALAEAYRLAMSSGLYEEVMK